MLDSQRFMLRTQRLLLGTPRGEFWQRTTNQLESDWGDLKRCRRRTHGRGKLTRDFQSLPEEYLLILNLENETYLQLVLGGSLESLPALASGWTITAHRIAKTALYS